MRKQLKSRHPAREAQSTHQKPRLKPWPWPAVPANSSVGLLLLSKGPRGLADLFTELILDRPGQKRLNKSCLKEGEPRPKTGDPRT